jgi:AAA15 family ATPase/GTPase
MEEHGWLSAEVYAEADIVVLTVDGAEYPYVRIPSLSLVQWYSRFSERLVGSAPNSRLIHDEIHSEPDSKFEALGVANEAELRIAESKTIDASAESDVTDIDPEDTDPVAVDDVGDYIRDKEIVDDLKTFDFDHLVFEPDDGEKYSVPFEFMGEGFKAIVGILWELLGDDDLPDVVFLEEPSTHMHPGYVRELVYFLIDLAREEGVQLFLTTHNNDLLNDFFAETLTDEEEAFLDDEFRLLQMQDGAVDPMDYREAEESLKDLKLDLRGV